MDSLFIGKFQKILCLSGVTLFTTTCFATAAEGAEEELLGLSLEELMSIEVVSAARKPQKWLDTAAAVYVLTNEDIRRSGVTTVPEALRMVPGVQVDRVNANTWAISARGFNSVFANKLQVLIDGRSIYTPLFSGVYWELTDMILDDIERIEVIRGPGAASWGANAVNGVINIITRSSADTQGALVKALMGDEEGVTALRYGGQWSEDHTYRVYGKYHDQNNQKSLNGGNGHDGYHIKHIGYRGDWHFSDTDKLLYKTSWYRSDARRPLTLTPEPGQQFRPDRISRGGNAVGRWEHIYSDDSVIALQTSYDFYRNREARDEEDRDTVDIDLQHQWRWSAANEMVWGLGYRYSRQRLHNVDELVLDFSPINRSDRVYSAFVQNDTELVPDRWHLLLNARAEHHSVVDKIEWQPGMQLIWTPDDHQAVWGSVTRAVRTPSISELSVSFEGFSQVPTPSLLPSPPYQSSYDVTLVGNSKQKSEELTAWQLGYRHQLERLSYDVSLFYHDYDELLAAGFTLTPEQCFGLLGLGGPGACSGPVAALNNALKGSTWGLEVAADWQVNDWWRLIATYSWLKVELESKEQSVLTKQFEGIIEGSSPEHTANIRSQMNISENWRLDLWWHYQDNQKALGVDAFNRFDARVAWEAKPGLEFALVGQNLFDPSHREFNDSFTSLESTEIERSVYLQVRWTSD